MQRSEIRDSFARLGFLRQPNLHERHEVAHPAQNRLHFPEKIGCL
jgi:hypothetical protein